MAEDTLSFVEQAKEHQDEKPFFAYIAFNAPHDPRQAPKEFIDRYPLKRIQIPKVFFLNILTKMRLNALINLETKNWHPCLVPNTQSRSIGRNITQS